MLLISKINFTTITYVTENPDLVLQGLLNCVPEELREIKVHKQNLQSQFKDKLIILELSITKKKDVKILVEYLADNIENKDFLARYLDKTMDLNKKSLHMRIDKFKTLDNIIEITTGSDVIKCIVSYTSYEKNNNTLDNVIEMFKEARLIG